METTLYIFRELAWPVCRGEPDLRRALASRLRLKASRISDLRILRRSLDARRRREPQWKFTVAFRFPGPVRHPLVSRAPVQDQAPGAPRFRPGSKVAVIGSGPAGMAAAFALAGKGYHVEVFEQGSEVGERFRDIRRFLKRGIFHPHSNILFGEGGAGTFSDGKLTARTRGEHVERFLALMVEWGAPESIMYDAHPHIGTDRLQFIVRNWRLACEARGCLFRFNTPVDGVRIEGGRACGVHAAGEGLEFDAVVLASGHSARPLYRQLFAAGVAMSPKTFAVGVRVEHPQSLINARQLGDPSLARLTGTAAYYLTWNSPDRRLSAYSFCMCPGGVVVPCADASDGLFTNGMSYSTRAGRFANAAVVVPVNPDRLPGHVLAGLDYQDDLERRAFAMGGGEFRFPAQTLAAYLRGETDASLPASSFPLPLKPADFNRLFSPEVNEALARSFRSFDARIPGFIKQGLMIGPESRTSSPLRIIRDPGTLASVSTPGIFPIGEGAGYAGGIVSSGADGLRLADAWAPNAPIPATGHAGGA